MVEDGEVYVLVVRSRTVPDARQLPEGWEVVIPPTAVPPLAERVIRGLTLLAPQDQPDRAAAPLSPDPSEAVPPQVA